MNTQREHFIDLIRDQRLQTLLQQLANACDQSDAEGLQTTLVRFDKSLKTHDCRGLKPLTDQFNQRLPTSVEAAELNPLITLAAAYLVLLQDQQITDHPLVVLDILNQYCSIKMPAEQHPEDWLTADTRPARVRPVRMPAMDIDTQRLASVFQVLLLRWLQKNDRPALQQLAQICRYMRSHSNLPGVMLFWQAAEAMAVALEENALAEPAAAQRLLGKLATFIRTQIERGEADLHKGFPEQLLKQLLVEIAHADSQQSLITDLQQTQQLFFIDHQQLLLQTLGWQPGSPDSGHTAEAADVENSTEARLAWLEQTDVALEQYHQHLQQWFKTPSDEHRYALLDILAKLHAHAEAQALDRIARLYLLMQQMIDAAGAPTETLIDLLEQAYQQLNQQIESVFETPPAPDIAPFESTVERFINQQDAPQPATSAFIVDADEHLQGIQSHLKHWQTRLPTPPPSALAATFNHLRREARAVEAHAIADLADSLYMLLEHPASDTQSRTVFELVEAGQRQLSDMQERLAEDLPVKPAREQLADISAFLQQQRRQTTPARQQTKQPIPAPISNSTLTTLKARQRTAQQSMQTVADQHLLLSQQLQQLRQQQPALAAEMLNTLSKAQSTVHLQIQSQVLTQQTLAYAALQPFSVVVAELEYQLKTRYQPTAQKLTLAVVGDEMQLPEFMVIPLTQSLEHLLCQLQENVIDAVIDVALQVASHYANHCLEITLTGVDNRTATPPPLTDIHTGVADMLLQSIGGQLQTTSNGIELQLPRVEQPLRCLITRCGERFYAIAAEAIESITHIDQTAFVHHPGQSMSYQHNDTTCQLVSPEHPGNSAGHIISEGQPVIITQNHPQPMAITVDEVINTRNCVFELLGPQLVHYPALRGVSEMAGQLLMLLDTDALSMTKTAGVPSENV